MALLDNEHLGVQVMGTDVLWKLADPLVATHAQAGPRGSLWRPPGRVGRAVRNFCSVFHGSRRTFPVVVQVPRLQYRKQITSTVIIADVL